MSGAPGLGESPNALTSNPRWRSAFQHVRYEHLVAGLSGGVVSTLVLHPLDLIKIRFQVNVGKRIGVWKTTTDIIRNGGIRGLYQGATPNIWGAGSAWGLYFFFYNILKSYMKGGKDESLVAGKHMMAGCIAGGVTLAITNPIWVVKTRMCLQGSVSSSKASNVPHYNGMTDGLTKLWRSEGIKGFYKGFVPGLFGVTHGALQFMAYEELKKFRSQYYGTHVDQKLSNTEYLSMAALSKVFAVSATYPYQVLRSRLQDVHTLNEYRGVVDVMRKAFKYEGLGGFYKGLFPNIIKVTPACCVTFLVYENIIHFLMPREEKS